MNKIIIHISDLHFTADQVGLKGLLQEGGLNKSVLGYLNRKVNPKRAFLGSQRTKIFQYLQKEDWDYLVISGDLTNFSHPEEFKIAAQALQPLEGKGKIFFVPGNHDRYVASSRGLAEDYFSSIYPKPGPMAGVQEVLLGEGWRVFMLDQAVPRAFYSSQGKSLFDPKALLHYVQQIQEKKIFIGHYPAFLPEGQEEGKMHQIQGREKFQQFLLQAKATAYLHGHIHKTWDFTTDTEPAIQVLNAGGCCKYESGEFAGFYRIELSESFRYQKISL